MIARVHLLCGLNGAGKTTYARRMESQIGAVRFTLDEWMLQLYSYRFDQPEYARSAEVCKALIWNVALRVLELGNPVILDWNQWNRARRSEWRLRASAAGYDVTLHYIDVPLDVALERNRQRTSPHVHPLADAEVRHLAAIFEPPTQDEAAHLINVSA